MVMQCEQALKHTYGLRRDNYICLLVCGSRDLKWPWSDFSRKMKSAIASIKRREKTDKVAVVVGDARGIDTQAFLWAHKQYPTVVFEAPWKIKGKNAGPFRNNLMIDVADYHLAFWDGTSSGTKHCIRRAREEKIPRRLYEANNELYSTANSKT